MCVGTGGSKTTGAGAEASDAELHGDQESPWKGSLRALSLPSGIRRESPVSSGEGGGREGRGEEEEEEEERRCGARDEGHRAVSARDATLRFSWARAAESWHQKFITQGGNVSVSGRKGRAAIKAGWGSRAGSELGRRLAAVLFAFERREGKRKTEEKKKKKAQKKKPKLPKCRFCRKIETSPRSCRRCPDAALLGAGCRRRLWAGAAAGAAQRSSGADGVQKGGSIPAPAARLLGSIPAQHAG